ncbi:helix-turn-helix domain-containing protein [Chelatococcus sp. GCM10030263]|uniref:helix-turn-helix domain-containing protein n=1 Tax=Chelatococcus sp. GCM10030263 TaxID=3273387 RepID=UPI0036144D67
MVNESLRRACEIVGGQTALADILGVRQSTLNYWLTGAKRGVPGHYVLPIEAATYGAVSRHQLRPDIYPERINRRTARKAYRIGPSGARDGGAL